MMKKVKLLHIQLLPLLSGVQNMMIQLLKGLNPETFEIIVISRDNGPMVDEIKKNGWQHITLNSLTRNISVLDLKAFIDLFIILRKIKPDIVHTHSSKTGFIGRITAKLAGVKLVIHTLHGFSFHPFQPKVIRFFYQTLESFAAMFADYNVFVNQFEKDYAIHKLGFNSKKTLSIYNGIKVYPKTKEYPFDLTFFNQPLKVVSVSRFSKQKNIIDTIQQAIEIVKSKSNVTFTFYGDGELFDDAQKLIESNVVPDKIFLPGWASNIQETLLKYDVFLLNSLWEGLPISILEAMSVGLPVIASNIKGNNELINEDNGWLIDLQNPNSLNAIIKYILKNPEILKEKGLQSVKKVTYIFKEELFINRYLELYNKT